MDTSNENCKRGEVRRAQPEAQGERDTCTRSKGEKCDGKGEERDDKREGDGWTNALGDGPKLL